MSHTVTAGEYYREWSLKHPGELMRANLPFLSVGTSPAPLNIKDVGLQHTVTGNDYYTEQCFKHPSELMRPNLPSLSVGTSPGPINVAEVKSSHTVIANDYDNWQLSHLGQRREANMPNINVQMADAPTGTPYEARIDLIALHTKYKETPVLPPTLTVNFKEMPNIEVSLPYREETYIIPKPLVPNYKPMPKLTPDEPIEIKLEKIYPDLKPKDVRGMLTSTSSLTGGIGQSNGRCFGEVGKLFGI